MQNLRSHLAGQRVDARGESWIVLRAEPYETCTIVTLRGTGESNLGRTTELITPFDRVRVTSSTSRIRRAPLRAVMQAAMTAIARAHGWCEPWTVAAAHIDILPWQLEPAMAAVTGATRLLLADAVGLGKTIQAALILAELRARGLVRRALVLTPASLRDQWAAELTDRFALDPVILDQTALARLSADLPPDVNPWSVAEIAISSIDLVKRSEARRALDSVPFDLLIVDEAHHLRPGTDRGALIEELAARVPWVVLATATPHSGDVSAYAFLRSLGSVDGSDEIATFRRGADVAGRTSARRFVLHSLQANDQERRLLNETVAYGKAIWAEHKALLAAVICRRAVSSPIALLRTLTRRRDLLATTAAPAADVQAELPWQEHDERDDVEADALLQRTRLTNAADEVAWLERLITLAEGCIPCCSKARAIQRLLTSTNETAIVFSEYRDTLVFLEERLSAHAPLAVIHGGMSARERRESVQQFLGGRARVLLATDAAGEGLNLQHRCRLVVNVELPWNPLRLEQRIGRVDRLGQTKRVHAVQLVHRASFEETVLARFERRLRSARRGLDAACFSEDRLAAAVFEGAPLEIDQQAECGPAKDARVADAVSFRRRVAAHIGGRPRDTGAVFATPSAARALTRSWIALFECDFHDRAGRLIAREAIPFQLDFDRGMVMRRQASRAFAMSLPSLPFVADVADVVLQTRRETFAADATKTARALTGRLQGLLRALGRTRSAAIQASLFDKRAEQQARATKQAAQLIRGHLHHRLDAAARLGDVHAATPRLVALWPAVSGR
jgi:superfamily II DNA or RNA helicase